MGVAQVHPALGRGDPSGVLEQNAGDDLEAVRDAVLDLLKEDLLVVDQTACQALGSARFGSVDNREKEPELVGHLEVQTACAEHQISSAAPVVDDVDLIGVYAGIAGGGAPEGGGEEGSQAWCVPLAGPATEQREALDVRGRQFEG